MRIGFAGTPAFAAAALEAILDAGLPVAVALTQPDRPRDRGWQPKPGPVKALADARGIPVLQPSNLKSEAERARIIQCAIANVGHNRQAQPSGNGNGFKSVEPTHTR